jgi:hypothetical protein
MVRVAFRVAVASAAVRVAVVLLDTPVVVTVALPLAVPGVIVSVGGMTARELLLDRLTVYPPDDARPTKYAVAVDEFPPTTLAGLTLKL